MRIISGTHKGRKIIAPNNLPVRPTTDMAKEALFNILANNYYFDELSVLDLFCGIGSISLEFASRETPSITCVDSHRGCIKFVNSISEKLELDISTILSDVYKFLNSTSGNWDIIFADPPYDISTEKLTEIVTLVLDKGLLKSEGLLIIEHSKRIDLSSIIGFTKVKTYGSSAFSFFSK
ncbi:MAG: RsmD family RNA methyltransferase [Bacteroidia bacterium]|nr:RsmD family RNA methyltransferase [Bacteroidia bacterium]MBT8269330.1 RsmD family RNA methyltransferase [Bacteroidia bacterium]